MNLKQAMKKAKETGLPQRVTEPMPDTKNRFKVTIKDRKTGEKTTFDVNSAGFQCVTVTSEDKIKVVRIVMDYPTMKRKNNGKRNG